MLLVRHFKPVEVFLAEAEIGIITENGIVFEFNDYGICAICSNPWWIFIIGCRIISIGLEKPASNNISWFVGAILVRHSAWMRRITRIISGLAATCKHQHEQEI
jgi:hypothetical protein